MAKVVIDISNIKHQRKNYLKGATPDQKKAIKYFMPDDGCKGLFTKVKDEVYDAIVQNAIKSSNSYQRALDKIGMDESELKEIPPVTLRAYADSEFAKANKNNHYRSNLYSITHIFFSSNQVYFYNLTLNMMKNEKKESTEEYFYKDITNFSTSTDTTEALAFKGCSGKPHRVTFDTQKFSLVVPGDKQTVATHGDIDESIRAMKNKLREKKM